MFYIIFYEEENWEMYRGQVDLINCDLGDLQFYQNDQCNMRANCIPGEMVLSNGNVVIDRTCIPCSNNTYSDQLNAAECSKHSVCRDANISLSRYFSAKGLRPESIISYQLKSDFFLWVPQPDI